METKEIYNIICGYFNDKPVSSVYVFGSYASESQKEDSDIDLLVDLVSPVGLLELARYKLDLEELLNLKVDLGTVDGVSKHAEHIVRETMKPIYVA